MELRNEFARVTVDLDTSGNGPRLMVRDERTQQAIYLDALELESLAWCRHGDLRTSLDPSRSRWREDLPDDFGSVLRELRMKL
jgi:hypothetical protein